MPRLQSLIPAEKISLITGAAPLISSTAMALFSCSDTQALLPSALMAMASGSTSWATVVVTPSRVPMRTPRLINSARRFSQALKSTLCTFAWAGATGLASREPLVSISEIEPTGSFV